MAEKRIRESKVEKYLVRQVKALGGEVRKVKWIGRKNAPDRLVMLPPTDIRESDNLVANCLSKTTWVELKATGKDATPAQAREHERMRKMGQRVVVIDSYEGVDALLA